MSKLLFVLWMLLYPVACAASGILSVKKREMCGLPKITGGVLAVASLLEAFVWIFVAVKLWRLP